MAIDRAVEARKKARAKRLARLEKSKGGVGRLLKGVGKGLKKMGVGVGKEEWDKGAPARKAKRKAKRKAAQERSTKKTAENKAKAKKGPVYSSKKDYSKAGSPKKTPKFGEAFSSARKAGKKTFTWKGKLYTTKTADDIKKAKPKAKAKPKSLPKSLPIGQSYEVEEKSKPSGPAGPGSDNRYAPKQGQKSTMNRNKDIAQKLKDKQSAAQKLRNKYPPAKYEDGGKVEGGGLFNWPSKDARNGGNK